MAEAEAARDRGEVPVGAVVVDGSTGAVLARAGNGVEAGDDPTAHAEMLAIRAAAAERGTARLVDCDIYVTLEPCAMCAQAIAFARLRRLYFGAADPKGGGVEHGARIFQQAITGPRSSAAYRRAGLARGKERRSVPFDGVAIRGNGDGARWRSLTRVVGTPWRAPQGLAGPVGSLRTSCAAARG